MNCRTRTYRESYEYTRWKKWVRKHYPEKFSYVDENKMVRLGDGSVGRVIKVDYFPHNGRYTVCVLVAARLITLTSPYDCEVL